MNKLKVLLYLTIFSTILSCQSDDTLDAVNIVNTTKLSDVIANELVPCPAVPNLFDVVDEA